MSKPQYQIDQRVMITPRRVIAKVTASEKLCDGDWWYWVDASGVTQLDGTTAAYGSEYYVCENDLQPGSYVGPDGVRCTVPENEED
jgi:hypothetical protein